MSGWGDFTSLAKTALKSAQKHVDKVLDIKEDAPSHGSTGGGGDVIARFQDDFFAAFGITSSSATDNSTTASDAVVLQEDALEERRATSSPSLAKGTSLPGLTSATEFLFAKKPPAAVSDVASKLKLSNWFGGSGSQGSTPQAESDVPASSASLASTSAVGFRREEKQPLFVAVDADMDNAFPGCDATFTSVPLSPVSVITQSVDIASAANSGEPDDIESLTPGDRSDVITADRFRLALQSVPDNDVINSPAPLVATETDVGDGVSAVDSTAENCWQRENAWSISLSDSLAAVDTITTSVPPHSEVDRENDLSTVAIAEGDNTNMPLVATAVDQEADAVPVVLTPPPSSAADATLEERSSETFCSSEQELPDPQPDSLSPSFVAAGSSIENSTNTISDLASSSSSNSFITVLNASKRASGGNLATAGSSSPFISADESSCCDDDVTATENITPEPDESRQQFAEEQEDRSVVLTHDDSMQPAAQLLLQLDDASSAQLQDWINSSTLDADGNAEVVGERVADSSSVSDANVDEITSSKLPFESDTATRSDAEAQSDPFSSECIPSAHETPSLPPKMDDQQISVASLICYGDSEELAEHDESVVAQNESGRLPTALRLEMPSSPSHEQVQGRAVDAQDASFVCLNEPGDSDLLGGTAEHGCSHADAPLRSPASSTADSSDSIGHSNASNNRDNANISNGSSGESGKSGGQQEPSTGYTSPSMEDVDMDLTMNSSDIEILSNQTFTPSGSERSSIRSGFVWTPAQMPSFPASSGHPPPPTVPHLSTVSSSDSISSAFALSKHRSDAHASKRHRRGGSDQTGAATQAEEQSPMHSQGLQKITETLAERLTAREQTVLELSKQNADLFEENQILKSTVDAYKSKADSSDADLEAKFLNVCEERDNLKRKCESLQKELASRVNIQQLQSLLREKEEEVRELRTEGEKLSKRELQQSTIIKKLREKEKETEKLLETQKTKIKELDDCKDLVQQKDGEALKYQELINDLVLAKERFEKRFAKLQSELEDSQEKCSSYKASLEKCYKELAELQKEKTAKEMEVKDLKQSAEEMNREDTKAALDKLAKERETERQQLLHEIEELRLNLVHASQEYVRKEDGLKWEISRLQKKLQDAEMRNEEISDTATSATRPLLRQIENLQASFRTQQANWERIEKSLYERISDAESKAVSSEQTEKKTIAETLEIRNKLRAKEAELNTANLEKSKLNGELMTLTREHAKLSDECSRLAKELDSERNLQKQAVVELTREKELLASQMEYDKTQLRLQYDQKVKDLILALDEKEKLLSSMRVQFADHQDAQYASAGSSSNLSSYLNPLSTSPAMFAQENSGAIRDRSPTASTITSLNQDDGAVEDWSNYSTTLETMRAKVQQRDGEVNSLKEQMQRLQHSRDAATAQLAAAIGRQQQCEADLADFEQLKDDFKELNQKHDSLLQLYGEKLEELEELRLDMTDLKELYRQQIEHFLENKP